MVFNIFDYLRAKGQRYLKSNKFEVSITVPFTVSLFTPNSYLCTSASLNLFQLINTKQFYNGKNYHVVNGRDYDPITLTFDADESGSGPIFFKDWMEYISPYDDVVNYPSEYFGTVSVSGINNLYGTSITSELIKCYPINFSAIEYDQNASDSIASYSVTFDYQTIKMSKGLYFL